MRDTNLWAAVDDYIEEQLIPEEDDMQAVLAACDAGGLPAIAVSTAQGKLLHLLARMHGAKRVLDHCRAMGYGLFVNASELKTVGLTATFSIRNTYATYAGLGVVVAVALAETPPSKSPVRQFGLSKIRLFVNPGVSETSIWAIFWQPAASVTETKYVPAAMSTRFCAVESLFHKIE